MARLSFVYFVQEGTEGAIKVGLAFDPARRLPELQIGNHRRLRLLGYFPGDRATELGLHGKFGDWNLGGEWFSQDAPGLLRAALAAGRIARAIDDELEAISGPLVQELFDALGLEMKADAK